jgi:alkylation response protein AidB-like acyl-CoA dehydrogenase
MLLSDSQQMVRETMRNFAQQRLAPFAATWDREHAFPREALRELAALGACGIVVPEAYGGAGLDYVSLAVALEEIAAGDGATSTVISVQNSVVCGPISAFGTAAQKDRYLKPLASGAKIGCFCLTEPHTGSDAAAIGTRAEFVPGRDSDGGGHYVLNGTKQFITSGKNADVAIVFALTDKAAGKKGMSAFIVDTALAGYDAARIEEKLGQRASDTAQIVLSDCRVPAVNLLGRVGEGYRIALANLEAGRIGIAAQSVGMARAAFEAALSYARERESFGKPIIEHQAIALKIGEMATRARAARLLTLDAAQAFDRGDRCDMEAGMAKYFASEAALENSTESMRIHGAYGYSKEYDIERLYRDAPLTCIGEGTNEMQRLIIARQWLKRNAIA